MLLQVWSTFHQLSDHQWRIYWVINCLAKAQYILISASKFCNTIIRLWVQWRHFSAFCKVLNNNFTKFWLFSVAEYLLRSMGLTLANLDESKWSIIGHNINLMHKKKTKLFFFHKNVGYLKHSLKIIVFLYVHLPWNKMANYMEIA